MGGVAVRCTEANWETIWAPYDEPTYGWVLEQISSEDVVLDIGAGDLRLARRMAGKCRKVYAVEIQQNLLKKATLAAGGGNLPNLLVLRADARQMRFPADVTVGVLLMRHCTHFRLYAQKLREAGAQRLITNARWRMGIEVIHLHAERIPFHAFSLGWYACWCGAVGFKPGEVERMTPDLLDAINEVDHCPQCMGSEN